MCPPPASWPPSATHQKAGSLAKQGVQVREADYDRPETLVPALTGASKLLLIPSAVFGQRYPQMHTR